MKLKIYFKEVIKVLMFVDVVGFTGGVIAVLVPVVVVIVVSCMVVVSCGVVAVVVPVIVVIIVPCGVVAFTYSTLVFLLGVALLFFLYALDG